MNVSKQRFVPNVVPRDVSRRAAVTLIEVLLVVMLLGASLAAGPRVGRYFSHRTTVRQDSDAVVRTLRLARETALMRQCVVNVRWMNVRDPATNSERTILDMEATPGRYSSNVNALGASAGTSQDTWMADPIELDPLVIVRANANEISFTPQGTAARDLEMKLSRDPEAVMVYVRARTGEIFSRPTS